MSTNRSVLVDGLHLFVLVGFAIAQPLYDMLSQNPEFFIAHKASPALIGAVVFGLSFGLPFFLIILEILAWVAGNQVRRSVHLLFVFGLAMVAIMPMVKQMVLGPDVLILGMALIGAILFVGFYARFHPIRLFLNVLTPAVVIFPLWFLLFTPIWGLIVPQDISMQTELEINNPVPVVVVVLDEFNITALLDTAGKIDQIRFPNFGKLADESWWFPNAIAAAQLTTVALPAILSGREPQTSSSLTPTAKDFPQNLFTMLGSDYHLNVIESMTALCPQSICGRDREATEGFESILFSDIVFIYLHLLAPPQISQHLPSLDAQWAGFGKKSITPSSLIAERPGSPAKKTMHIYYERDLILERFLTQIRESPKQSLHFLHVLVPHVPYEHLASGQKYLSGDGPMPAGILDNEKWGIGVEPLILTAYHRYLQQIGYVDRFLGQLRHTLKSAQLYDNALIILTADHGVSFRPGTPRRHLEKETTEDILRIPMIVKLPGQREGKISDRVVNGVDVLPTITDVLEVRPSWEIEGRSMFDDRESPRPSIEITSVGHFNPQDHQDFPRLQWQTDHFQEHSSLDHLVPKGPSPSLIGQPLSNLSIGQPEAMRVFYPDLIHFEHVNPDSGFVPALFRAYVLETKNRNLRVAVALNGRIRATTKTVKWNGNDNYLSVLLPPKSFKRGRNLVGVYLIDETGAALIPIPLTNGQQDVRLQQDDSGRLTLLNADGSEVIVEAGPKTLRGHIDRVSSPTNLFILEGWVADLVAPQPADTLYVFAGKLLVSQVKPEFKRPDVVKALKQEGLLHSGFRVEIPLDVLTSISAETRVIVLSKGPRAVQLHFNDEQKKLIQAVFEKKPFDNSARLVK
jgi:hypothetical protein